jgi:hypothetical protein
MQELPKKLFAWVVRTIQAAASQPRPAGFSKSVEIDGVEIVAHELTVGEMRQWLVAAQTLQEFDMLSRFLFHDHEVTVDDLVLMSSASRGFIESATASELVKLVAAIKDANPFFFQFRQRLKALAQANP